jgi:Mg/Co/Ni transporter MgtE
VFLATFVKMKTDRNKILVESIKRLLRRGATTHLVNIVNKTHAADLSVVYRSLSLLEKMRKEESEEVEDLLRYEDDTAGGIMVRDFIALTEGTTAKEAIETLQKEHSEVEMPFYLYVVENNGKEDILKMAGAGEEFVETKINH